MITLEMMPPLMFGGLIVAMLIGYPVQPGSGDPSASVLLSPTDPAAPIAVGAEVPEGMAGQGSGKAAAKRPVIEYLDEAPAVHAPRRKPA